MVIVTQKVSKIVNQPFSNCFEGPGDILDQVPPHAVHPHSVNIPYHLKVKYPNLSTPNLPLPLGIMRVAP